MKLTVAVCTWNRAELLDRTLAAMQDLAVPPGIDWELLVVNNNCTDNTDEVIARHEGKLPIRRLFERQQGLSRARNRATAEARGDLILWTDDDVLVEPDWLAEYAKAAREWPEAAFFGGTVDPWFAVRPPRWVEKSLHRLGPPFAVRQLGPDTRRIGPGDDLPFGANMATRRSVLGAEPFAPHLGRCGTASVLGEESDVMRRLLGEGHHGVWVGPARVRHYVPAERLTLKYLWDYFSGSGRSRVRQNLYADTKTLWGAPRWVIRRHCAARVQCWLLAGFRGAAWFRAFSRAAYTWGIIRESRAVRRETQLRAASA